MAIILSVVTIVIELVLERVLIAFGIAMVGRVVVTMRKDGGALCRSGSASIHRPLVVAVCAA